MSGLKVQKFFKGDLVQIGDMPIYMPHFEGNCQAIVEGTYAEMCDAGTLNGANTQYSLYILPSGVSHAWYEESQLTFIAADQFLLLPEDHYARKVFEAKRARDQEE